MQEKKAITWSNIKTHVLAYGKTIDHVNTLQTSALQRDTEARVDLWHPATGMHETE
jgi:hypothetical protein